MIAGHEPCGIVEETGPGVKTFRPGDRVIVYHIAGCGLCRNCRAGWYISCTSPERAAYGWQRDGGHAPFLLAEESTLVRLPDWLTYLDGAIVACGLGTAFAACVRAAVSGRDTVLVTGLGPVGMGASLLCRSLGARVLAVEGIPERRSLATTLGFEDVITPGSDALRQLMDATDGHGVEVAIDCSGNAQARRLCLEATREWGRAVYVGEGGTVEFSPSPHLIHKQISLYGSWVCSLPQMEELVEHLVRWRLHPDVTVTHRFPLERGREAYEVFDAGGTGKVAIVWDD